jgi:hypothetical protein
VSLAHFLAQTVFPERYGGSTEPSLLIERELGGWDAFYKVDHSSCTCLSVSRPRKTWLPLQLVSLWSCLNVRHRP